MRIFSLILLLATICSCGKETNEISTYKKESSYVSEKSLSIPHNENGSLIRSKLLNKIVESNFPDVKVVPSNIIQIHDELKNSDLLESELKDYEIKEKILTKVVVSFSDREEIYFVRDKIPAQNLVATLNLNPETDRKFKLMPTPYSQTFIGATFYIVSVNHEDLMRNDQDFYSVESSSNNLADVFYFKSFQSILIKVDYDFKVQSLGPVGYKAPDIKCGRGESPMDGYCGSQCSYTANLPIDNFERTTPKNLQELGLVVNYFSASVDVGQIPVSNARDGHFEIKINSKEAAGETFTLKFLKTASSTYSGRSARYNFVGPCNLNDKAITTPYTLNTQVNIKVAVKKFGRGEELRKIIL